MRLPPFDRSLPLGAAGHARADAHTDGQAFEPLLAGAFAQAWALPDPPAGAAALRDRLLGRTAASRRAEQGLVTVRRRKLASQALAPGVQAQPLYAARPGAALRPGEPLRVRLFELADAALLSPGLLGPAWPDAQGRCPPCRCEWLVVQGSVRLGDDLLSARDFHFSPPGQALPTWRAEGPALLFLRESLADAQADPAETAFTLRDADAGWPDFAPGIQRRVLWQRDGLAALLYLAQAGAQVPRHQHGHDEECLMLQGELFLDDLLLQAGDYQLAPAGSGHRITETDTGVVIYAHGDLDLQFLA